MNAESASPQPPSSLGELEATVLRTLWDGGELSTPEVVSRVAESRQLAYTTVLTVLQRLHRKGVVSRRLVGKVHWYTAAVSREELAQRKGETLAEAVVELSSVGLSAFLSEAQRLDPAFVAKLRERLIEESDDGS
jgi:predicted transcriptional regulator